MKKGSESWGCPPAGLRALSGVVPLPLLRQGAGATVPTAASVVLLQVIKKRRTACLDLQQWHTTCIADIPKPTTPWAFRAELAGQAQGSAQDVEPVPLYEAADNLIPCVEDQQQRGLADTYSNLKITIVDALQMSALVPTAELKQPGQFVCSLIVVSMLLVARGLAHNVVTFRTKRINCGKIL